ncbi:MAG TPA: histidine phosphatase family protein [Geminicoccaceae bacterium]|nr:histidine phosphatase family protein [Geminicoccaceae bacterium]
MTEILLTRHGDVPWLEPRRFRGRAELKLTDRGLAQAEATARRMEAGWRPQAIYASPLGRTLRTARIIAEPLRLPVQPIEELVDIDYGDWQGLTADEARARWPTEAELWHRRPDLVQIPGGETLQDVLARAARALRLVVGRHPQETVVLVAHDCVNRVVLLHALEMPLARYWQLGQDPCAINRIEASAEAFVVHSVNDTAHLQAVAGQDG